ncbi:retrovirus-related pol polyprotein from transposon TNT 1-94, partial [Tanacetum coccineum]
FRRYLNRKRDNRKWLLKALDEGPYEFENFVLEVLTIPRLQTVEDLEGDDFLLYDVEMELMNVILLSIPNKIYNSVDACTSAKDMWKRVERLMRGTIQNKVDRETCFTNEFGQFVVEPGEALVSVYNRFAQLINDLDVTQVRLAKRLTVDSFDDLFDYLQQFEKLVNTSRAKKLEKSHDPLALVAHTGSSSRQTSSYYVTHPTSVVDYDDEYQQDDVHNNSEDPLVSAMLLLAKAITQNFSNPTNNRLRASSNTRNQAIIQGDRVNIQSRNSGNTGRNNRRAYVQEEVVEGMNAQNETGNVQRTLRTPSSGNTSTVQCYNCSGKGHYARNCPKPRVRDSKYFMEQMLLAKQDEAGVILTDEQNDFLFADASRMEEIEELSANICLMARIQPADHTSDDGPSYESAFISEVQSSSIDENNEPMYPTHTKIINSTIGDDQINSNIKFDSFKGNVNSGSVEKDTHVPDLCAVEKLARNAYQEAEKQRIFAKQVQTQNTHLTSQIEMYKERVRILEGINKDNNYLNEFLEADERAKRYNKQAQSQLVRDRDIIRDLKKQRDKLDLDVKNYKRKNEELQKTHSILKRQMSEKEDTYHDTILDLEAKLKKNVDLILKLGNSLQGMFMLGPKPLSVYDQQLKHGLGYPDPYTLKQAISKCPKLYVASSLGNLEIPLNVRDSGDILEDAFKSQQKMTEKMNDPIAVANKQSCWTINYKKLNALYEDFVPQKELSVEQKYFSSSSIPSVKIPVSNDMPTKAIDRFIDLLRACPHHGFSELHQLDTFYNALNANDQDSLNSAAGGNFFDKMPRECLKIIESKSKVRNSRNKAVVAKVSSNSSTLGISTDVSALTTEVSELKNMMKTMLIDNQKKFSIHRWHAITQHSEYVFTSQRASSNFNQGNTNSRPPMVANQIRPPGFPPIQNNQNRFNQNRGSNFNQGQVYQPPIYQPPPYQTPTPQMQGVSKTDFENYVKANDAVLRNMQNQGQGFQNQMTNLTEMLSKFINSNTALSLGTLPSQTVTNPREHVNAITTTNVKLGEGPSTPSFLLPKFHVSQSSIIRASHSPIPIKDSDPVQEEIDIFLVPDDLIPPGVENDDSEDEDNSTFLPENESSILEPSSPRPPPEPPDVCLNFKPNTAMKNDFVNEDFNQGKIVLSLNVEDVNSFTFIIWTFLPYFTYPEDFPLLLSFGSEDFIFDPGIFAFHF